MGFARDLMGGALILLVSLAAGAVHNSIRSKPMALLVDIPGINAGAANSIPSGTVESPSAPNTGSSPLENVSGRKSAEDLIDKDKLRTEIEAGTVIVIDARSKTEFDAGHIPGAMNIPYENLSEYFHKLTDNVPLDATLICYCQSVTCEISELLARELRMMGYEDIRLYRGGWDEWREAGYPVEGAEGSNQEQR